MKFLIKTSTLFFCVTKQTMKAFACRAQKEKRFSSGKKKKMKKLCWSTIIFVAVISDGDMHGIYDET